MVRRVVITGIGVVSPLADGAEQTWEKLIAGESGIRGITSFDVSDLPSSGISSQDLQEVLREGQRWKWLVNGRIRLAETRAHAKHVWMRSTWKSGHSFTTPPEVRPASGNLPPLSS